MIQNLIAALSASPTGSGLMYIMVISPKKKENMGITAPAAKAHIVPITIITTSCLSLKDKSLKKETGYALS